AKYILQNKQNQFVLAGHTDVRGTREYNLTLGQKRADNVKQALMILGISANQVETISYGKETLANPGLEEADHAKNRRVELLIK
ncbi:MAG: OmpA family protein, partial [Gammaproteobacteria bacterium]|nr:OmpA family protein [Gammaproteobacteria bacterium]